MVFWRSEPCTCDIRVDFNTGLEYTRGRHSLGGFGGSENGMFDLSTITWTAEDREAIRRERPEIVEMTQAYIPCREGSILLLDVLMAAKGPSEETFGALVYHQLLYTPVLEGTFQTGCCMSNTCLLRQWNVR